MMGRHGLPQAVTHSSLPRIPPPADILREPSPNIRLGRYSWQGRVSRGEGACVSLQGYGTVLYPEVVGKSVELLAVLLGDFAPRGLQTFFLPTPSTLLTRLCRKYL